MTTTNERRARLAASPGWQRITEAAKEATTMSEIFIQYSGYWQGDRYQYAGPFASEDEAQAAVADLEVLLDCDFVASGQHALNIKVDKRYGIVPASRVDQRDFVACADMDGESTRPLFEPTEVQNKALRRLLGLKVSPGRPATLDNPRPVLITLDTEARAAIDALRQGDESDAAVVRRVLTAAAAK